MNIQLGKKFDQNKNAYFKDKKMLLIFDKFELVCHDKEVSYPTYLLEALHAESINCIFITKKQMTEGLRELGKNLGFFNLSGLPIQKSLILMLANQGKCFFNFKSINPDVLYQSKAFVSA